MSFPIFCWIELYHDAALITENSELTLVLFIVDKPEKNKAEVLYNCGRISFILSFLIGYILSFGLVRLRTVRLSARAGAHIEYRCSRSRAENVTPTNVIIKTPDRKWDWSVNDVMPRSDELRILVILEKKQLVDIRRWSKRVEIWSWMKPVQFVAYGMRRAFVGSYGTVSIIKNVCVSLSPRVERLNSRSQ